MGNYNASPTPDLPRLQVLARNYSFLSDDFIMTDEWNIDAANRVCNFADGTNNVKVKVKYNPQDIPLT